MQIRSRYRASFNTLWDIAPDDSKRKIPLNAQMQYQLLPGPVLGKVIVHDDDVRRVKSVVPMASGTYDVTPRKRVTLRVS